MKKKVIVSSLIALLTIAAAGGLFYTRTKAVDNCDQTFKNNSDKTTNVACVSTSRGVMLFELYPDAAPKTIERFKKISNENKFYDNLQFYRIVKDFVAQGGIQDYQIETGNTENIDDKLMKAKVDLTKEKIDTESNFAKVGVNKEDGDKLVEEGYKSNDKLNSRPFEYGSLALANAGPATNSTEFFIVTSKDAKSTNVKFLNGRFTNFGKIIKGQDVLNKLNESEVNKRSANPEKPVEQVIIYEIRVK